ncbi:uracil-DNA glycosylase [Hyphobacterium sp. CCMP332]|nr:uracil-DNA glycosylase [Hyphobacterium sp. CCMP332]
MEVQIENSWKKLLQNEFEKDYFEQLVAFVKSEYSGYKIYPPGKLIFSAFEHTPFDKLKVVIIGQDPYHGEGQAHGLCFSVPKGIKFPPSLQNIFKELNSDLSIQIPEHGNLEHWADQGVLLLNATLTVRAKSPGSHQNKGWEQFTDAVIERIHEQKKGIVYILWGSYAQKKGHFINRDDNLVIESAHPSPFSVHRGFFGSKPFSRANSYLIAKGLKAINW